MSPSEIPNPRLDLWVEGARDTLAENLRQIEGLGAWTDVLLGGLERLAMEDCIVLDPPLIETIIQSVTPNQAIIKQGIQDRGAKRACEALLMGMWSCIDRHLPRLLQGKMDLLEQKLLHIRGMTQETVNKLLQGIIVIHNQLQPVMRPIHLQRELLDLPDAEIERMIAMHGGDDAAVRELYVAFYGRRFQEAAALGHVATDPTRN